MPVILATQEAEIKIVVHCLPRQKARLHKNKHDHAQSQMKNMFVIVELLFWNLGKGGGKKSDSFSITT
jgi:hypothetical protein